MKNEISDETTDRLAEAFLALQTKDDILAFFDDVMTISEIKALAQRLEVAEMLGKKVSYADITEKTGASTATISRVNRCLRYGAGGYRKVLERFGEQKNGK